MSGIIVISLLMLFSFQLGDLESHEFSLVVKVEGFQPGKGILKVCLFDSEATFINNAMVCEVIETPQNEKSISLQFSKKILSGKYAITVYQDVNKNNKLDRNWLGIPTEPYGFSNNPSTFFGPPSFRKAAFDLSKDHSLIVNLQG